MSVEYLQDGGIVHVRLNRPEKRNAIDAGMIDGLLDAQRRIREDRSLRAVVLSGAGPCFCAGLDASTLGEMASGSLDGDSDSVRSAASDLSPDGAHRAQQIAWGWQEVPVPVIAAVHGAAMGGGFHIALGADLRFVTADARIAFVEITWGLVPDLSGTQALRRLVPLDVAKRLVFTGEPISGEQAVAWHLATAVSPDPLAEALETARTIASRSPDAVRAAKRLLNESVRLPVNEGLANEFSITAGLMGGKNQIEAVVAKLSGRAPLFEDPT